MKGRVLLNPQAGRGKGRSHAERLRALARRHDLEFEIPASGAELAARARQSAAEGCPKLLVAGGDGSYHCAVQGLAGSDCALVPIALGTGNDLARELGLPLAIERAVELGVAAPVDRMDLGRVGENYFCGVAGTGIDSEAAEYSRSIRRLRGPLVYVWSVVAVLARFAAPELRLELPDETIRDRVMLSAFANTRYFGGGMKIAPGADRADGLFDVVLVRRISRLRLLTIFPRVYRGTHLAHSACEIRRAARLRYSLDRPMACWGDGERLAGVGPQGVELEIVPGALAVPRLVSST
ncbi:MAG: diacylglycerol kinase family protein [Thermoanaerobaculia bacterium]